MQVIILIARFLICMLVYLAIIISCNFSTEGIVIGNISIFTVYAVLKLYYLKDSDHAD